MLLSTEKPRCGLVDMSGGEGNLLDYQARARLCLGVCNTAAAARN